MNKKELLEELDKAIKIKAVAYEQIKQIINLHFGGLEGMDWREACLKSELKRAMRITDAGGVVYRECDGLATIKTKNNPHLRKARPEEVKGHNDWTPV